jgi:esterase/lipase superfamily enzyme
MNKIYFVTNRRKEAQEEAPWFGTELETSLSDLRIGWADVSKRGTTFKINSVYIAPESTPSEARATPERRIAPKEFSLFGELKERMAGKAPDTVLFIHGFSYSFPEALVGAAHLKSVIAEGGLSDINLVIFTWPSDGKMIPYVSYASDRRDAKASGAAGGRALLQLRDFLRKLAPEDRCLGRIHILAHSMGNYVLRNAIQSMLSESGQSARALFEQVLLLAPDEDDDALQLDYKLKPLAQVARRTHVYFNAWDIALEISDKTKGNPRRLGTLGPQMSSAVPDNVVTVDASAISRALKDLDRHHYYLKAPEMASDMAAVLMGEAEDLIKGRAPVSGRRGAFRILKQSRKAPKK